jgi:hypothetical protein
MRTVEEKRKHLNHLDYEVAMLHYCCSVARSIHPAKGRMARAEVKKMRRYRSGAKSSRPIEMGTKMRSQFIAT